MPKPVTVEGESTLDLWQGAWIAALLTGVVVWGLIFYAIWRFRRRSDDEVPIQTRYNLPLEIFYTIFPIIMVIVFFSHTIRVQNIVLNDEDVAPDQDRSTSSASSGRGPSTTPRPSTARTSTSPAPATSSPRWCSPSARPPASSCAPPTSSTTSVCPAS